MFESTTLKITVNNLIMSICKLRFFLQKDEEADEMKLQEPLTKGADLDSG